MKRKFIKKSGFAMLFAVLASSVLVTIGIALFRISLREVMMATSAQDTQKAYYAADSARECALYWDIKKGAFPTCTDISCSSPSTSTNNIISCNGKTIVLSFSYSAPARTYSYSSSTFFQYSLTSIEEPDSGITITKTFIPGSGEDVDTIQTVLETLGHNSGIIGRRVERAIRQTNNN